MGDGGNLVGTRGAGGRAPVCCIAKVPTRTTVYEDADVLLLRDEAREAARVQVISCDRRIDQDAVKDETLADCCCPSV